ncbi:MAG: DUF3592 domain-containing protein [Woeseiaceae bacterium]|nr:DUF3592 domain-containing protein [Woeseiaceae bacterium]
MFLRRGKLASLAIIGLFAIAGALAWQWSENRLTQLADASLDWPSVEGLIVESRLDTRAGRPVRVTYEYVVGNRSYRNDVVRFDQNELNPTQQEALVSAYRAGRTIDVYFNPDKPGESVLVRGSH